MELPVLLEGDPAHGGGVELGGFEDPFQPISFCDDSMASVWWPLGLWQLSRCSAEALLGDHPEVTCLPQKYHSSKLEEVQSHSLWGIEMSFDAVCQNR